MNPTAGLEDSSSDRLDRLLAVLGDRLSDDEIRHVRMLAEINEPEAALIEVAGILQPREVGVSDTEVRLLVQMVVFEGIDPQLLPLWLLERAQGLGGPHQDG